MSFGIALAIAWFVASGGFGGNNGASDTPPAQTPESHERPVNRPESLDVDDAPRKGPRGDTLADEHAEGPADGVLEQFCDSRFTFESARDSGTNALRRYLERCARFDTDYVEAARDALDLD